MTSKVSTLVKPLWLNEQLKVRLSNLRLLDASWHMPRTQRNGRAEFLKQHIPTAQYFDIDECADQTSEYSHMLPTPKDFSNYVENLGIDNNTHVVVYDNNATFGMFSAQRVWWLFRVFGHNIVSILDGGMPAWLADGYETTATVHAVKRLSFQSTFNPLLYRNFEQVVENLNAPKDLILDARSAVRFYGTDPEPRRGIKPGHIPCSINVPFTKVLDPEKKVFKQPDEIKAVFKEHGVDLSKPIVASCGSGVSGCMLVLAAYLVGKEDVALYDGSWTEWYLRAKPEQMECVPKEDS